MTSTAVPTGANSIAGVDAIVVDTTGPAAPTGLSATANLNSVTISFTPGVGGPSAVTNYKYSLNGGTFTAFSPADTASPVTISGLTTGTSYTIALRTVTAIGDSASSTTVTITPSNITGLSTVSYTEQSAAASIASAINFSGGSSYDGKYIDFAIGSAQATEILGYTTSGTASTTNGAVSIVGTSVYLGNGTSADPIGSIDSTRNGHTSSFSNAGFESGATSPWTPVNTRIDLGVTQIAGFTSQDTSNYAVITSSCKPSNDDRAPSSLGTLSVAPTTATRSEGTYSLQLSSSGMTTAAGGDVVHGPAVYSDTFQAAANDVIYFDWQAQNGGDYYHVLGYILNTVTGTQTEVLDSWGATSTWSTSQATIPSTGTYRFVFVSGTQDFSCGQAAGASLYIDNVRVFGSKVNDSVATKVAQLVTYRNTSDAPAT
ncbi:MAG: hypothetical protein EBU67_11530, partial [Actinobacteria bacterium]|nr:hypothetical protein [Actinomycetota bacterium]